MIQQLPMRIIQLNGQLVRGAKSVVPLDATGARISTVATLVVVVQLRSVAVATTGGTDVTFWLNIFPHLSFWFSYLNSPLGIYLPSFLFHFGLAFRRFPTAETARKFS